MRRLLAPILDIPCTIQAPDAAEPANPDAAEEGPVGEEAPQDPLAGEEAPQDPLAADAPAFLQTKRR